MPALKDLTGVRFGKLVGLRLVRIEKHRAIWDWRCDCGAVFERMAQQAKIATKGVIQCRRCDLLDRAAVTRKHDGTKTRLHNIWIGARQRCRNPKDKAFGRYGGRGIAFDPIWDDFAVFRDWSTANGYSDDLELDRIDVDGPYSPANCRWTTHRINTQNTRRTLRIEFDGAPIALSDLAAISGIHKNTLRHRIKTLGMTPEEAILRRSMCETKRYLASR
jgi:AraC-like DNA-binding protein